MGLQLSKKNAQPPPKVASSKTWIDEVDEELALYIGSFLLSYSVTSLRATCVTAGSLFKRNAPLGDMDTIIVEGLVPPKLSFASGERVSIWEVDRINVHSPLRVFFITSKCAHGLLTTSRFKDLGQRLFDNKDFVMHVIVQDGHLIEYASERLRADRDVVNAAIDMNGYMGLQFAHKRFTKEKDLCLRALKNFGYALEFVHESIRDDPDILKCAAGHFKRSNSILRPTDKARLKHYL